MVQANNFAISIYSEETPNPATMKFVANKLLYPGQMIDFPDKEASAVSPLANALFAFPFVQSVFIASNFVTLTKKEDSKWKDIIPQINFFLKNYLEEGYQVINEKRLTKAASDKNKAGGLNKDIVSEIKEILATRVKPLVEMDGGAITFENYKNGTLTVSLHGACSGCPSSMDTLKNGIESIMKRMIPEVKAVEAAE